MCYVPERFWYSFFSKLYFTVVFSNFFFLGYRSHNTQHVHVPLGTAHINAYFQDAGLSGGFAG